MSFWESLYKKSLCGSYPFIRKKKRYSFPAGVGALSDRFKMILNLLLLETGSLAKVFSTLFFIKE